MFKYDGFDEALDKVRQIFETGGKGHSCGIYSYNDDHIHRLALVADWNVREVGGEPPLARQVRDELGAADRRGGGSLASSGLTEQERREILHTVPQPSLIPAHVVGEDVIPKRFAQLAHGFAFAGQRAMDEVEGAPQLKEESENAHEALLGLVAAQELRDRLASEWHRERGAALRCLPLDERVDLWHVAVVAHV